ncbi:MAG: hypothetical protein ACLP9L_09965 [Thermoguttaceae bacterium]
MESDPKTASLRYGGLVLALAVAIGILGANAFADAAGFRGASMERGEPTPGMVLAGPDGGSER